MGDLDREKHDVDVIERVLGGVRDRAGDDRPPTHVVDLHTEQDGPRHTTLEVTVGIASDSPPRPTRSKSRRSRRR